MSLLSCMFYCKPTSLGLPGSTRGARKKKRTQRTIVIADFQGWIEAWSIYDAVLSSYYPHLAPRLFHYQHFMTLKSCSFQARAWLRYDSEFRLKLVANGSWHYDVVDTELWASCFAADGLVSSQPLPLACYSCGSSAHFYAACTGGCRVVFAPPQGKNLTNPLLLPPRLFHYQHFMTLKSRSFQARAWLRYDSEFRLKLAANGSWHYDVVDTELWASCFAADGLVSSQPLPLACYSCGSSAHFYAACPHRRLPSSFRPTTGQKPDQPRPPATGGPPPASPGP